MGRTDSTTRWRKPGRSQADRLSWSAPASSFSTSNKLSTISRVSLVPRCARSRDGRSLSEIASRCPLVARLNETEITVNGLFRSCTTRFVKSIRHCFSCSSAWARSFRIVCARRTTISKTKNTNNPASKLNPNIGQRATSDPLRRTVASLNIATIGIPTITLSALK